MCEYVRKSVGERESAEVLWMFLAEDADGGVFVRKKEGFRGEGCV